MLVREKGRVIYFTAPSRDALRISSCAKVMTPSRKKRHADKIGKQQASAPMTFLLA